MLCPWLFSETNFQTTKKIFFETNFQTTKELANFSQILGILNNIFKQTLVQKFSRIKVYNALAFHILLHGSEIWTLRKKKIKNRLTLIKMQIFRYSFFDHKRNEEILEKLKVEPVDEKLRRYKSNLL